MQSVESLKSNPPVDFLWLELTNQCNLQCTHCYAESGPQAQKGTLSSTQYLELMAEAFTLGCRRIQFIGGEPTLNRDLPVLIRASSKMGFEFIEVFTNLTMLSEELLQCFVENGVHIATSVYGPTSGCHDATTLVHGSFEQTIRNLRRLVKTGLSVRAGIVEMEMNAGQTDSTIAFLREMGVHNVSVGRLRHFGRGGAACEANDMSELCGNCAGGTLCVSPTGKVSPCIMSKHWAVGSISEASLSEIATGNLLRETRQRIYEVVAERSIQASCPPDTFGDHQAACHPSYGAAVEQTYKAVVERSIQASCPPDTFGDHQAACGPSYGAAVELTYKAVIERPIQASCPPDTFGDRQATCGQPMMRP